MSEGATSRYLYLIQHGEAVDEAVDPERPLTEKGKHEVEGTAKFMKERRLMADEVWHSGKLRAKQTAEIIAQALGSKAVEKEGLKPNDPVAPIADFINKGGKNIAIAGHMPFLSKLTSLLVTGSEDKEVVQFKMGKMVCIRKEDGKWSVEKEKSNLV